MTVPRIKQYLNTVAGQVRTSRPLMLALPCAVLAFAVLAATVQARTADGPKCFAAAIAAPGFDSLAPTAPVACIRFRI